MKYAVSPTFNGTIYQVQSYGPIDSKPLTSALFERELVQATGACDPGGGASLSRRLTLTQSGEFDTYTQAGAVGDGVKLKIRVSSGQNASECANAAADNVVDLLRHADALRPLRRVQDISHLVLTGAVTQRAQV